MFAFLHCITLVSTIFCTFIGFVRFACQTSQSFFDLFLYILVTYFSLYRFLQTRFAIVTLWTNIRTRCIIYIHPILLYSPTFPSFAVFSRLRSACSLSRRTVIIITIIIVVRVSSLFRLIKLTALLIIRSVTIITFALVFTLFTSFFLRFLLRTSRLIQSIQVNLTGDLNLRFKLSGI